MSLISTFWMRRKLESGGTDESYTARRARHVGRRDRREYTGALPSNPPGPFQPPSGVFAGSSRFELVRELGRGAMGIVYEALDRHRGGHVALKALAVSEPEHLLRFKQEFRRFADVVHPNVVRLHELVEEEGSWFFTMELVEGADLLTYVRGSGFARFARPRHAPQFDEPRLRDAFGQAAQGLRAVHDAGKVHRDVKSSNILATEEGRVVLLDFGLAADAGGDDSMAPGVAVGTPIYMAPEQATSGAVGAAADLYALGAVLYEALTGQPPFSGGTLAILYDKQRRDPTPVRQLAPSVPEDLATLCHALLDRRPADRPGPEEVLAVLRPKARAPARSIAPATFVGRRDELARLLGALERTRGGEPVTVVVEGPWGVGRSSLLRQFFEEVQLARPDAWVLEGRCLEQESAAYKAVDGVIDALARKLRGLPHRRVVSLLPRDVALLGMAFPALDRVDAIAEASIDVRAMVGGGARADPRDRRQRIFAALKGLLSGVADQAPLVVAIDDLQWADADSLALLDELLRPPDAPVMLLLVSMRQNAAVRGLPGAIARGAERIELAPLPLEDAIEVARLQLHALGATEQQRGEAARVTAEAGGHPAFIAELARHVVSGDAAAPVRLEDLLRARLERLGPIHRRVLEIVCAVARPIELEIVSTAAGLRLEELGRSVADLREARLVRTGGSRRADLIEPFHDRVREEVLAGIEAEALPRLHRALALAMKNLGGARAEDLARHWLAAGERERAARYAEEAALAAMGALAFEQAAAQLERVLELRGPSADRASLEARLGDALACAGQGRSAAHAYLRAADLASGPDALALRQRAADQLLRAGHVDEGLEVVRDVLSSVGLGYAETPRAALGQLLVARARARLRGTSFRERPASELAPMAFARLDTCAAMAIDLGLLDNLRASVFHTRNLLLSLDAGEPARASHALAIEATFLAGAGVVGRADRVLEQARVLADRSGDVTAPAWPELATALVSLLRGQWRAARERARAAEELFAGRAGSQWEAATSQLFAAFGLAYLGDLPALRELVPRALRAAEGRDDRFSATCFATGLCSLSWLLGGEPDEARRHATEAMACWSQAGVHLQHYYELLAQAHIDLYEGEPERALGRIREREPALRRAFVLRVVNLDSELVWLRGRSALALATQGHADRPRLLAQARRDAVDLRGRAFPWARALGELLDAGLQASQSRDVAAATGARRAVAAFDALEMQLHAAAARRGLGRLLGGDAGRRLLDEAATCHATQGVADPDAVDRLYAPGLP